MNKQEIVDDYAKVVVARYLKRNGFTGTLNSFLRECGRTSKILSEDKQQRNGSSYPAFEELETLIGERIEYAEQSLVQELRDVRINDSLAAVDTEKYLVPSWDHRITFTPTVLASEEQLLPTGLPIGVSFCAPDDSLMVSTSKREVCIYKDGQLFKNFNELARDFGIIRLCGSVANTFYYYFCCLDGTLILERGDVHHNFKLHRRLISHIRFFPRDESSWFIVSCGLDNYLKLHILDFGPLTLREVSSVTLQSPCTSMQVGRDAETRVPTIFLTRQDFTHVLCYAILEDNLLLSYKIALNNSQFSAFAFNVRDLAILGEMDSNHISELTPRSTLLVATSHIPFMRLLLVEIPPLDAGGCTASGEKIFYDKVLRNMATEVPQDSYSQPILGTLGFAQGVIVGSNQGVYAIDVKEGDSWQLQLPHLPVDERIKCMQLNISRSKVVVCLSSRSCYVFNLVTP